MVLNPRVYRVDCGRNAASVPRAHGGDYVHVVELLRSVCLVFIVFSLFFKLFSKKNFCYSTTSFIYIANNTKFITLIHIDLPQLLLC